MSANWEQYFEYKDGLYRYKDTSVVKLPANLPMPPTETFCLMFADCIELKDITALSNWNVSNIKSMRAMFYICVQLKDITALANWDVSKVEDMSHMFWSCHQFQDISALANWDVSNVKDMSYMFHDCHQLQDITALANWDVSNVENMSHMFWSCHQLNISDDTNKIKSYLQSLPKHSYPKQDHASLLKSLWERIKPLLKDTTKLNGYFKGYTIEALINKPNQKAIQLDLPSDWQNIELPQWNP